MVSRVLLKQQALFRNFVRNAHHRDGGVPGENLPFDLTKKLKLTLMFAAFFGSGIAVPFLAVRHQLLKK